MSRDSVLANLDLWSVLLYLFLVGIGWLNIYSASLPPEEAFLFDISRPYGKQLLFAILCIPMIAVILALDPKFIEASSSIVYILSLVLLAGLFLFGKEISGARSWYDLGGISIQPSEFVKVTTALALAKYLSDPMADIKKLRVQLSSAVIIFFPAFLILLQPDTGSALIFAAFYFPLHRQGISNFYFFMALLAIIIFISTLLFNPLWVSIFLFLLVTFLFLLLRRFRKKVPLLPFITLLILAIGFTYSVSYIYQNTLKQHQRDRIEVALGMLEDPKGVGYNTNQAKIAVGSGGWSGKGFLQGTQTKGGFVPEQHTDYIFCTVGEEWGFIGTSVTVLLFVFLIIRVWYIAERQRSVFGRVYGYGVAGILFIQFALNVGMVIGLVPTIGIPLPFFSYGGSALIGFTLLLFLLLKLDAHRKNLWV